MHSVISPALGVALLTALLAPLFVQAQLTVIPVPATRTALLIGVWDYKDETFPPLPAKGIRSDLQRMEAKLKELGFQVTVVENPSVTDAEKAVDAFGATLMSKGGTSLFYFTGHGAEEAGHNYLIPTGTNVQDAADLKAEALAADRVLARMEKSGIKVNLVFLDCCRNALTKAGGETGLAAMSARGALIGFATRSGDLADASDDGSPYTNALVKHLGQPGISLPDMHTLVTLELESSGSKRRPGQYVDLGGIYHLVPALNAPAGGLVSKPQPQALTPTPPVTSPASILDQGVVGKLIQVKLPGDVVMKFCYCPPTEEFVMGSPKSEADRSQDEDQVTVRISKGFWTGQMEVTQGQWKALMGTSLAQQKAKGNSYGEINGIGDDHPMYFVSWDEAQAFIARFNEVIKLPARWKFALLTEAQWEYACRAGKGGSVFAFGDTLTSKQANFGDSNIRRTTRVGSYEPNAWGLHDMHGNLWEWCADWYGEKLMGGKDPQGPVSGSNRVFRGGSWFHYGRFCRSAYRFGNTPDLRNGNLGFRVAVVSAER